MTKLAYLQRIFAAYLLNRHSHLTFWHDTPAVNTEAFTDELGPYFMTFHEKAHYPGPFDAQGIPLLDYHGQIGCQYNPIAIAQYALGNYNLARQTGDSARFQTFLRVADWLVQNLTTTPQGTRLWAHHFDFEYFRLLKAPWFSGLAQGQGLSVLVRAFAETRQDRYLEAAQAVWHTLDLPIEAGGVQYRDEQGFPWIEEYLVAPPTHILNGFIWALWGISDYYRLTQQSAARQLFDAYVQTIVHSLPQYDLGFWSLYELTPQRIRSIASSFYHQLHITQLRVMHLLTNQQIFLDYAEKWQKYTMHKGYCCWARLYKIFFKLLYY